MTTEIKRNVSAMKTVGILGGMSSHSSLEYYRMLNEEINALCGGWNSAELILYSFNFAETEYCLRYELWDEAIHDLVEKSLLLEAVGADFVIIASNTMHFAAPKIEDAITIPFLHIVDATAEMLKQKDIKCVGLLGTMATMTRDFHKDRFAKHGIDIVVPPQDKCELVHNIILNELTLGKVTDQSRNIYIDVIHDLENLGSEGIVLGCTEIELLVKPENVPESRLFDTSLLHCKKVARLALGIDAMPVKHGHL